MINKKEQIEYFEINTYYPFILTSKHSTNKNLNSNQFDDLIFDGDIDKLINKIKNKFDSDILQDLKSTFTSNVFNTYFEGEIVKNAFYSNNENLYFRRNLFPCYVEFNNSSKIWIFPELIIFMNLYMFIKINIPFKNFTLEHIYENEPYKYFKRITLANNAKISFEKIEDLTTHYMHLIERNFNSIINPIEKSFSHIAIIRYDSLYDNENNVKPELSEMAYSILKSPTTNYNNESSKESLTNFFKKQSINYGKVTTVINPRGNCISFVYNDNQNSKDDFHNQENSIFDMYAFIGRIGSISIEYAILMNMLKYINDSTYFNKRLNKDAIKSIELSNIRDEYNLNKLLLYQLLESSTEKLIQSYQNFEEKLYLLHNTSFYNEKSKAIDEMIANNINNQNEKLQNTISFVNLALVTLFGLPTVKESLQIIKYAFDISDLPYVTLDSSSLIVWILCILASFKFCNFDFHFFKQKP